MSAPHAAFRRRPNNFGEAPITPRLRTCYAHLRARGGIWLGVLTLGLIRPTCRFGFLAGDRELLSKRSPVPFGLWREGAAETFLGPAAWDGVVGPVGMMSHMLDIQLFRPQPFLHHLTSVWWHVFNIALFFGLARRLSKSAWAAGLAASIFALHPMQLSAVLWISERRILLATFFALCAAHLWLRLLSSGERRYYAGALVAVCLASLTYPPTGILIAAVVVGLRMNGGFAPVQQMRRKLAAHLPFLVAAGAIGAWSFLGANSAPASPGEAGALACDMVAAVLTRVAGAFATLPHALGDMVAFRSALPSSITAAVSGVAVGLACASVGLLYFAWRFRRGIGWQVFGGLAWFVGCGLAAIPFQPEDAFVPVHWPCMGNAGLALGTACFLSKTASFLGNRRLVRPALALALPVLVVVNFRAAALWSGDEPLARHALAANESPREVWRVWHSRGVMLSEAGKHDEAKRCYRRALCSEFDSRTLLRLGTGERQLGKDKQAWLIFKEVVALGKLAGAAQAELGLLAQAEGNLPEANREFCAALEASPREIQALIGLAMIRACAPEDGLRDGKQALELARRALRLTHNSQVQAITALGAARAELGQFRVAQAMARKALFWTARLGGTNEAEVCEERLETYLANKPWRMELPQQVAAARSPAGKAQPLRQR